MNVAGVRVVLRPRNSSPVPGLALVPWSDKAETEARVRRANAWTVGTPCSGVSAACPNVVDSWLSASGKLQNSASWRRY